MVVLTTPAFAYTVEPLVNTENNQNKNFNLDKSLKYTPENEQKIQNTNREVIGTYITATLESRSTGSVNTEGINTQTLDSCLCRRNKSKKG